MKLALGLMPFAGIASLWFVGVVRDRLGTLEDQFSLPSSTAAGFYFSPWSSPPLPSPEASSPVIRLTRPNSPAARFIGLGGQ